jgi:hypothetical protein
MQLGDSFRSLRTIVTAPPTPPPAGQPPGSDTDEYAIRTYRYVRVLIVALTVGLLTSVAVEWATAGCLLGSISAYYYTPARGLFTGGLIGIGVCLIAIRGENDLQDGLLNAAGLLGPMVALIPMHLTVGSLEHPSREASCIANAHRLTDVRPDNVKETAFGLVTAGRVDSIRNNTWALLIMVGLGLLLLAGLIAHARRHPRGGAPQPKWWPWALSALLTAGVWALYLRAHGVFIERVHFASAITMFAAVSVFAVVDGIRTVSLQGAVKRGVTYVALGVILLAGCGAIMLIGTSNDWPYSTFTAEVWGIGVFLLFWVVQTIDLWDHTSRRSAILSASQE